MNQRLVRVPRLGVLAVVAAAAVGVACQGREGQTDSLHTTPGTKAAAALAAPRILPGALPMDIDSMPTDSIQRFVNALRLNGGPSQPRNCSAGACRAKLDAVDGQRDIIGYDADGNGFGTLVIRAQNEASSKSNEEAKYGLKGGGTWYFFVAHKVDSLAMSWTLHQWEPGNNPRKVSQGSFTECEHEEPESPTVATALFRKCTDPYVPVGATKATKATATKGAPAIDADSPGWMTCSDGCCTAGDPMMITPPPTKVPPTKRP